MKGFLANSLRLRILMGMVMAIPALVFVLLLNGPVIHLTQHRYERIKELQSLRENVYRQSWLDSATMQLQEEVSNLHAFQRTVHRALSRETQSAAILDPLRQVAQSVGCEVLRLSPSYDEVGGLPRLKLRLESRGDFGSFLKLFRTLRTRHPEVYVDDVLLRQSSTSAAKLDLNVSLVVHMQPQGARP